MWAKLAMEPFTCLDISGADGRIFSNPQSESTLIFLINDAYQGLFMNAITSPLHPFDKALQFTGEPANRVGTPSADYQNMVGPFGGITAAQLLQAVLEHPDCEGSPVALTINYLGPIKSEAFEIRPTLLRANRSNQHWRIELVQGVETQCSAICVLAKRKETWCNEEVLYPEVAGYETLTGMPEFPGMMAWIKQYEMRFICGGLFEPADSGVGVNSSESILWIADKPSRKLDFTSLTAIADAFFPRLLIKRKKMVPFGTVSLTVHFHVTQEELEGISSTAVLGKATASKFAANYFDQTAELWSEDKRLLVTSSQMVYYKE